MLGETYVMLANSACMLPPLFLVELQGGGRESEEQVQEREALKCNIDRKRDVRFC